MFTLARFCAGSLLTVSLALVATAFIQLINPPTEAKEREGAAYAMIFFSALSGFCIWSLKAAGNLQAKKKQDSLLACFYELVRDSNGRFTLLSFGAKAGIDGADAKRFLDARASEFDGNYEASEDGNIVYVFPRLTNTKS